MSLTTNYNPNAVLEFEQVVNEIMEKEGCSLAEYIVMLREEATSWENDLHDLETMGHDTRIEQVMFANAVNELHYLQDLKRRVKKEQRNA